MSREMSELSGALKEVLEKRGVLSEVQARLRAEVYQALDDQGTPKPKLCRENLLLNELIRNYLAFNQYNYTKSVLLSETGQPKEPLDKDFLARELNLVDEDNSIPLLYKMLVYFLQRNDQEKLNTTINGGTSALSTAPSVAGGGKQRETLTFEKPIYDNTS